MSYVKYRIFDADWSILKISSMDHSSINSMFFAATILHRSCSVLRCSVFFSYYLGKLQA